MTDLDDLAAIAEAADTALDDIALTLDMTPTVMRVEAAEKSAKVAFATFRNAISPSVTLALVEVARADDPEPDCATRIDLDSPEVIAAGKARLMESSTHAAWRIREEARANLDRALEENRG